MAIREGEYYRHKPEVWDAEKCRKAARHTAKDGMGTPYHFKGYIGCTTYPGGYGKTRYNGGCTREGDWWEGEIKPLPIVAEGYAIVRVPTWGFRIIDTRKENVSMFTVDSDCFKIELPNGYTLTFTPCDAGKVPHHLQHGFNDNEHALPQPMLCMNVSGNGCNVNHHLTDPAELGLQIKTFAEKTPE